MTMNDDTLIDWNGDDFFSPEIFDSMKMERIVLLHAEPTTPPRNSPLSDTRQWGPDDHEVDPSRLGRAVILRAFHDATSGTKGVKHTSAADREDARKFLVTDGRWLRYWCSAAGIKVSYVIEVATRLRRMDWHLSTVTSNIESPDSPPNAPTG